MDELHELSGRKRKGKGKDKGVRRSSWLRLDVNRDSFRDVTPGARLLPIEPRWLASDAELTADVWA
jgi:hypothetical protein